jgi:6,7-dimethyl-8-ribityllumazine synthase
MIATQIAKTSAPPLPGARVLVVEARFYDDLADELLRGACGALEAAEVVVDVVTVPGALEIPSAIAIALDRAEQAGAPYDAAVALGCVIRGETGHYDIVAGESARAHGPFRRAPPSARQRHPHRRERRAGLGAGAGL